MNFLRAIFDALGTAVMTLVNSTQLFVADFLGFPRPSVMAWSVFPLNLCKLKACSLHVEYSLSGVRPYDSAAVTVTGPDGSERELNLARIEADRFLSSFPGTSDIFAAGGGPYVIRLKVDGDIRKSSKVTLLDEKTSITINAAKTVNETEIFSNPRQVQHQIHIREFTVNGDAKTVEVLSICKKASRLLSIIYVKQTSGAVLGHTKIDLSMSNASGAGYAEIGHNLDPGQTIEIDPPVFLSEIADFVVLQERPANAPQFFDGDVVSWEFTFVVGCVV